MSKLEKMIRFLPSSLQAQSNPYMRGILWAWSSEDDNIVKEIENAKDQLYVKFAEQLFLDYLGANVGYIRPRGGFSDATYRQLIPLMSFTPKQIKSTMEKVLKVIYGENERTDIYEVNRNEIIVIAPWNVHPLDDNLRGTHHFKLYSGPITAIDAVNNIITMELNSGGFPAPENNVKEDEWKFTDAGQNTFYCRVLSNDAANSTVTLQVNIVDSLANFKIGERITISNAENYPGSFIPSPTAPVVLTQLTGVLGQAINPGNIIPSLLMQDASSIPNTTGYFSISYGTNSPRPGANNEEIVPYLGRPSDTTLTISPTYVFTKQHSLGATVNYMTSDTVPRGDGSDYSVYFYGVEYFREVLYDLFENQLKAAGIVIKWYWIYPTKNGTP